MHHPRVKVCTVRCDSMPKVDNRSLRKRWRHGRESSLTVATTRISSFTTGRSFPVAIVRSSTRARRRVRHLDYQPVSLIGLHCHDIVARRDNTTTS